MKNIHGRHGFEGFLHMHTPSYNGDIAKTTADALEQQQLHPS